jgi:hypothetical protein
MLSAIIAYQVLRQENPQSIEKVKAVLEKHPWYTNQWQASIYLKMFPLLTATWCCLCTQQDGLMIFARRTSLETDHLGITSTYHSNQRANRQLWKPENPSQ